MRPLELQHGALDQRQVGLCPEPGVQAAGDDGAGHDHEDGADEKGQDDGAAGHRQLAPQRAAQQPVDGAHGLIVGAHGTVAPVSAGASLRPPVAMSRPIASLLAVASVHDRDDASAVHDRDAVGELQHLVQLGGDEQHGRARVALEDDLPVDELDAAHVQAAGGLVEHQQLEVAAELARHDELLLVAAGERPGADRRGGRANVELLDGLLGPRQDGRLVAHDAA